MSDSDGDIQIKVIFLGVGGGMLPTFNHIWLKGSYHKKFLSPKPHILFAWGVGCGKARFGRKVQKNT